jgi:hypothetical protein
MQGCFNIRRLIFINSIESSGIDFQDISPTGSEMSRRRLGAEIAFMQFTMPTDRAERSPKGVGSIEFDRRSAFGVEPVKLNCSSCCPISGR